MHQRKKNSHDPCGFTLTFQLSLDIKTQLSKVSIPVSISRLNSWISNLCSNLETVSTKQKILDYVTSPMCKMLLFGKMIVTFELILQIDAQHCVSKQPVILREGAAQDWAIEKLPGSHWQPLLGKVKTAGQGCGFCASSGGSLEWQLKPWNSQLIVFFGWKPSSASK